MMLSKEMVLQMIEECFDQLVKIDALPEKPDIEEDLILLGDGSQLDSVEFVAFVTELEERLQDKLDRECYLVLDEISQFDINSPKITVDLLASYVVELSKDSESAK